MSKRTNPRIVKGWKYGPYSSYDPAWSKASSLQRKGHHIRWVEPEYGEHTRWKRQWWIHGYSYGAIPVGAELESKSTNPSTLNWIPVTAVRMNPDGTVSIRVRK